MQKLLGALIPIVPALFLHTMGVHSNFLKLQQTENLLHTSIFRK
nr:MAG TPA: hypothetical protein [Bacteriophage sp.]